MNNMRNIPILFFSIITITVLMTFNNCSKPEKKEKEKVLQNLMGKNFILPDSVVILNNYKLDTTSIQYFDSDIKMISLVDGRCPACISSFSEIVKAKKRLETKTNNTFKFLCFIHTKDYKSFKNNYYPLLDPQTPLIIQEDLSFLEDNPLPGFGVYRNVLTINNKIQLVGNPAINKELEQLYLKEINKH